MSLPRQILRGSTVMVTRRCTQRQFLLLPSKVVNQVLYYCLALASNATRVQVHVACVLSNHYHLVVTDPDARLPEFVYILNKYVAKCVNAYRGRWENLFAAGTQASYVRLEDDEAILDKAVYAITNPVAGLLVKESSDWPGVNLWQPGRYKAPRPTVFFKADSVAPKALELRIEPLPISGLRARQILERLRAEVADRERMLRIQAKKDGKRFLGAARIRAQSATHSPPNREPRRGLSPTVATRDKWRRVEILQRIKQFCVEYRDALAAWVANDRDVVFPAGVYKMRVVFGVRCADS